MALLTKRRDGHAGRRLPAGQALRRCVPWLIPIAVVQLSIGLIALLGDNATAGAGMAIAAFQPITAVLIFLAGRQLQRGMAPYGALLMGTAAAYLVIGSLGAIKGFVPFLLVGFVVASFVGPCVGAMSFAVLARAIARSMPDERAAWTARAIGSAFPVAALFSIPFALHSDDAALAAWVLAPQLATTLACALAYRVMRAPRGEADLVDALEQPDLQGFYLLEHTHPMGVATALPLPETPFELAQGEGTPLGNPVLDQLLPVYARDPQRLAEQLSGHEATVLAVLHAWPKAQIRDNTLSWEASLTELLQHGPDLNLTLRAVSRDLRALQALLATPSSKG